MGVGTVYPQEQKAKNLVQMQMRANQVVKKISGHFFLTKYQTKLAVREVAVKEGWKDQSFERKGTQSK